MKRIRMDHECYSFSATAEIALVLAVERSTSDRSLTCCGEFGVLSRWKFGKWFIPGI
jgi:hypothetical protein